MNSSFSLVQDSMRAHSLIESLSSNLLERLFASLIHCSLAFDVALVKFIRLNSSYNSQSDFAIAIVTITAAETESATKTTFESLLWAWD